MDKKNKPTLSVSGRVIWITGLSGAGKTTLARALTERLKQDVHAVVVLDGDELREVFGTTAANADNHGREGRLAMAMQYAHLCRILAAQGLTVVIATISLFQAVHHWNREHLPNYTEVYLKVPLDELRRRDPKGIYQRFDAGELTQVAGLDLAIDEPGNPDLLIEFSPHQPVDVLVEKLIQYLTNQKQ